MKITEADLDQMAIQALGISKERWINLLETLKSDPAMNLLMKQEWYAKSRETEGSIRDYYRSSDIWFANTFNHGKGALLSMANAVSAKVPRMSNTYLSEGSWYPIFAKMAGGRRLLDYGGGLFKDSWPFVLSDYKVDQAEVRGPVTEFLKAFIDRVGLQTYASVVPVDNDVPIHDQYDGIICFETLEHVLKPLELTRHLVNHLHQGCPIILSASFGAPSHAPYHVASNAFLSDQKTWFGHLRDMGLENIWMREDQHCQIWRKK